MGATAANAISRTMKPDLKIGDAGELAWMVDGTMTITLGGVPQATVFSTPSMIMLMEQSAREALRPFLEDGEESVGAEVQVEHTGVAVLGSLVRGVAKVVEMDGRRVGFEVRAYVGDRVQRPGVWSREGLQRADRQRHEYASDGVRGTGSLST